MHLTPLPAFNDNYLWLWHHNSHAVVVDPGDGEVVMQALSRLQLHLDAILVTHHHADHTGGVNLLRQATQAVVYGPAGENIPGPYVALTGGDTFDWLGQQIDVIDVPGHTAGHIGAGYVFTGGPVNHSLSGLPQQVHAPGVVRMVVGD